MNWPPSEEAQLVEYLARRICDRARGRFDAECLRNYPRDVYFVGNLRPSEDTTAHASGHIRELLNKLAPVAFGADCRLRLEGDSTVVEVVVTWASYYRVLPTFEQQRQHQGRRSEGEAARMDGASESGQTPEQVDEILESEQTNAGTEERQTSTQGDRRRQQVPRDSLMLRFKKIDCEARGKVLIKRNETGWRMDVGSLQVALDEACAKAQRACTQDPIRFRTDGPTDKNVLVPEKAISSQTEFDAFVRSLTTEVLPVWRMEVRTELQARDDSECTATFHFVNRSPQDPQRENTNLESFFFDSKAHFSFTSARLLPFEIDLAPRGFRYDRNLWGRGFNCEVERNENGQNLSTTHSPIYRQMRYESRTEPRALFRELSDNPLPALSAILSAMQEYRGEWEDTRRSFTAELLGWKQECEAEYERDLQQFESEMSRFGAGVELIEADPDIQLAFKLTNDTFGRGANSEWRLFQIVFFVSQIPSIAALARPLPGLLEERKKVDIIYFPTGGGKTEAYLAVLVFHCFFDRLRGKSAGVTAWTRFPLRLLTLQQTQRVADVVGIADLVRKEQGDARLSGADVDGFSVGYFVGLGGSPNEIADPSKVARINPETEIAWGKANDREARQDWKRVARCPSCRTSSVTVEFDPVRARLFHRCARPQCAFPNGELPVYIVDNEVYRSLPSIVVGTIDKLAGIGNQRKMSQLLGVIDGRCSVHGYYRAKCCQKDCSDPKRLRPGRPSGLSGPTLFVQDELHLLKEGLGTFDGHYETFTQQLVREFGFDLPLKVIASSATIEAFERQIEHLYGRSRDDARTFPGRGPTLRNSFYARTLEHPQRVYVGIIPHNKTIFNTILELVELFHRELQGLARLASGSANPYGGRLQPGTAEWREVVDYYSTSLTYFLAGRELNSIRTDLEGDVNPNLMKDALLPVNILELTGGTSTDDVQSTLEHLEKPSDGEAPPDAVLATSMVSHGVDIDRLNAMIFYGMPRQNAEYIQASSRVGRSHVGLILTCLHPARERDQSHYSYFGKFHEFLGQLVEPVAINRWAKFSVERTLPGLFMGVLLQLLASRSGTPDRFYILDYVKQQVSSGAIRADDFVPMLERSYFMGDPPALAIEIFRKEIRSRVQQFLDQIISAGSGHSFVSDVLIPKPMRSLRDVDEPIDIELDSEGTIWGTRGSQQSGGKLWADG
jgi:hypothetical protein